MRTLIGMDAAGAACLADEMLTRGDTLQGSIWSNEAIQGDR